MCDRLQQEIDELIAAFKVKREEVARRNRLLVQSALHRRIDIGRKQKAAVKQEQPKKPKKPRKSAARHAFERSEAWRRLSAEARRLQPWCSKCSSTAQLQADHIKPKSRFPDLALDPNNVQVLCWPCNRTKAARYEC